MFRSRINLLLICFVLAVVFTAPSFGQEENLFQEGKKLYQSGEYDEAIKAFSEVVKKSVNKDLCFKAYLYLGYTYFTRGNHNKARKSIENSVQMKQNVELDESEFVPEFIDFYEENKLGVVGIGFFESIPSSASVYLDKKKIGFTPVKKELLSQKYYLRIVKRGYEPIVKEIEINIGEINYFKVDFSKGKNWKTFLRSSVLMIVLGLVLKSL